MRRGPEKSGSEVCLPPDRSQSRPTMETLRMELLRKKMPTYSRLQKPVLVLNASFEPINVCAARRALVLVLKGIATAEEHSANSVHSPRRAMKVPSVIRLLEYRRIPHQTRALSR